MNAFNRFLIVLIVLLTIGSAVLAVLLYQNRTLMRERADLLAEGMADMVSALEQDSRTGIDQEVTFQPVDPVTGDDAGTLSWTRYLEDRPDFNTIKNAIRQAEGFAEQINTQRNHLAAALAETAALMRHVDEEAAQRLSDADPDQYEEQTQTVLRLAEAVAARTEDMIESFINIGEEVNVNVSRENFFQRREEHDEEGVLRETDFQHQPILSNIAAGVSQMAEARDDYRDSLITAVERIETHEWSVAAADVRDPEEYDRALSMMEDDYREINAELIRSMEREREVARLEDEMATMRQRLQQMVDERNQLARRLQRMGEIIEEREYDPDVEPEDPVEEEDPQEVFPRDTVGEVVEVNRQFGFIIIDLGAADNVMKGLQLLIDRDGEFIARVEVTEVEPRYSIADVVPRIMVDEVKPGDMVISP